jgi:dienelactone hydrolase
MNRRGPLLCALLGSFGVACATAQVPGTLPAELATNRAQRNAEQWDAYLLALIETAKGERERFWSRNATSPEGYAASVHANRERLARAIGVIDRRVPSPHFELLTGWEKPGPLAEAGEYAIWPARWTVLPGVHGEGLVLLPKSEARGLVVLLPDASQEPEAWAGLVRDAWANPGFASRLAASGIQVVILALVNRASTHAGDEQAGVTTNQSHREWIYRQAAPVGRHIIGYEVQKVLAVIDAFAARSDAPAGVFGYGEGGLIALHAAALDARISVAGVSGYFQPRERLWSEPLYRDVKGLLTEFGDAEIASLIAPRALVVEPADGPRKAAPVESKSGPLAGRSASAGTIEPAKPAAVELEFARARRLPGNRFSARFELLPFGGAPGGDPALAAMARALGGVPVGARADPPAIHRPLRAEDFAKRQARAVRELGEHAQMAARMSEGMREAFLWSQVTPKSAESWPSEVAPWRRQFADNFIGRIAVANTPVRARSRPVAELSKPAVAVFEVVYDVLPGVEDWGLLLLPTNLPPGERRPVVVCQHGANSEPADVVAGEGSGRRSAVYRSYAMRLAERGFVAFAPSLPNHSGGEPFRALARKANPLGLSIFSLVAASQSRLLQWLRSQPFVDGRRIAYYGMSYGGKAALRLPAALDGIAAVVCSGDFNDYVRKMTWPRADKSGALFNASPDMIEFDLANTFGHAEMAALIAPRPFMVEHGLQDRVAPAEWVAAEYAKVRRLYLRLGIPERTAICSFDGPHTVMGTETFAFLHRVLAWPSEATPPGEVRIQR